MSTAVTPAANPAVPEPKSAPAPKPGAGGPGAKKVGRTRSRLSRWGETSDREFLAPVLEILETPPSPISIALIWTICIIAVTALVWAYIGRIDIIATAQGKFEPAGLVKVVQPLLTGTVADLKVANGSSVNAGDAVLELDNAQARADVISVSSALASSRAERLRRIAAIKTAKTGAVDRPPAIAWPDDVALTLREREERVLSADFAQLYSTISSLKAQLAQKTTEADKLKDTIATQKSLVMTLQERVNMRTTLMNEKAGAKAAVIDATETLQLQQTQLSNQQGQLASLQSGDEVITRDIQKTIDQFIADNAGKLDEAERQIEDAEQKVAKAQAAIDHLTLRAPISGRVQSLVVTNVGQVVSAGQILMRIVPENAELEISAYVLNRDIGFVTVGQEAVVKVEPFPFTRYGSISARVVRIARDAIPEPDANAAEGDPTHQSNAITLSGAERTQNLVFPVILKPEVDSINVDGVRQKLTSGMAASVEFKTGSRRMLEYLFSPLVEIQSRALRER